MTKITLLLIDFVLQVLETKLSMVKILAYLTKFGILLKTIKNQFQIVKLDKLKIILTRPLDSN